MVYYSELNEYGKAYQAELAYRKSLVGKTFTYVCEFTGATIVETITDYKNGLFGCASYASYYYHELTKLMPVNAPLVTDLH
jgi:hypothetical protein